MKKDTITGGIIDAHLTDLLNAYRDCAKLHQSTTSPKTKQAVRRIQHSIKLAFNNLAPLGVHAKKRFDEAQKEFGLT